jgi:hypothetical protein
MPFFAVTNSGLQVRLWMGHLLDRFQRLNIHHGPMFCGSNGQPIKAREMEKDFFSRLEKVQESHPNLIPVDLTVSEEYGIYRSFRRGATSEAVNRVKPHIIDANNRWCKVERSGGRQAPLGMRDHYTDPSMITEHLLLFLQSL